MATPMVAIGANLKLIMMNDAACQVFDLSDNDVVGQAVHDIVPNETAVAFMTQENNDDIELEGSFTTNNGTSYQTSISFDKGGGRIVTMTPN